MGRHDPIVERHNVKGAQTTRDGLHTTMQPAPGNGITLTPSGRNYRGNSSKGLTHPHDCGPNDIPVIFDQEVRPGRKMAKPATMSSPLGPATGIPARVRKTR